MLKNILIIISLSAGLFGMGLMFAPFAVEQLFNADANLRLPITFFGGLVIAGIILPPLLRKEVGGTNIALEVVLRLCWMVLAFLVAILWANPEFVDQFNFRQACMVYGIALCVASMAVSVRAGRQNWLQSA